MWAKRSIYCTCDLLLVLSAAKCEPCNDISQDHILGNGPFRTGLVAFILLFPLTPPILTSETLWRQTLLFYVPRSVITTSFCCGPRVIISVLVLFNVYWAIKHTMCLFSQVDLMYKARMFPCFTVKREYKTRLYVRWFISHKWIVTSHKPKRISSQTIKTHQPGKLSKLFLMLWTRGDHGFPCSQHRF